MELKIFDLDDTLISSSAKITVHDSTTHKEIVTLTPSQFNHFKSEHHQYCNFEEFTCPDKLSEAHMYNSTFTLLQKSLDRGEHVSIITARDSHKLVNDYFISKGFNIDPFLIFAVGSEDKYTGNIPERKKQVLEELVKKGYKTFTVYDDNLANLEEMKSLEAEYDYIKIKITHVVHGEKKRRPYRIKNDTQ